MTRLETMGRPDPTNLPQYFSIAPLMRRSQPDADKAWFAGLKTMEGVTAADLAQGAQGMSFSGRKLAETLVHVDLTKTAPSFPIPWFVIHGREDLNTPIGAAHAYFEAIKAPKKDFVVIEGAGHFNFRALRNLLTSAFV